MMFFWKLAEGESADARRVVEGLRQKAIDRKWLSVGDVVHLAEPDSERLPGKFLLIAAGDAVLAPHEVIFFEATPPGDEPGPFGLAAYPSHIEGGSQVVPTHLAGWQWIGVMRSDDVPGVKDFIHTAVELGLEVTASFGGKVLTANLDGTGQVIGLEEKPREPKSDLALVGVYMFTPCVHEAVRNLKPSRRGELEITEAIQWLLDRGRKVASTTISGYWKDTGNVADMLEVNRLVLETVEPARRGVVHPGCELIGRVVIEEGAEVSASRIVGPVIVGAGTRVADSYLGPFTSVAEDCTITDSEIEYSIVLRGASISGVRRIEASIIGRNVEVTPAPRVPKAHRLILGDHSKVQISS